MESTWSPHGVYMESIAQLSKYALSCVDSSGVYMELWSPHGVYGAG
jgi:hypothetical protein